MQPVVLPRVDSQRNELAEIPGFVVPDRAIDAQSLIAYADLVISAGGTMNREAVALGTPVYTTFEGRLGAVDERLIEEGRLSKLQEPEQLDLGKRAEGAGGRRVGGGWIPIRRDPRVLVDLLLSRTAWLSSPYNLTQCADGSARRPFPSTGTLCPSSRWTGRWSRSRTTSPSSCASTAARPSTTRCCAKRTIWWVLAGSMPVLVLARVYQRRWRYAGQRDYEAVARAVLAVVLLSAVGWRSCARCTATAGTAAVALPNGVIVLFTLLALVLLVGVRVLARTRSTSAAHWPRSAERARTSAAC